MPQLTYEKEITGLVVIDPYNDFISEGGKIWDRIKFLMSSVGSSKEFRCGIISYRLRRAMPTRLNVISRER